MRHRSREIFVRRLAVGLWSLEGNGPQELEVIHCVRGVVSPLLSNLYLHEALDHWFVQEIQPRLKGAAQMVRFADDAVLCFQSREEAQQVLEELGKPMTEYGLKLHPEKTKLVDFRPPERGQSKGHGSLNFL